MQILQTSYRVLLCDYITLYPFLSNWYLRLIMFDLRPCRGVQLTKAQKDSVECQVRFYNEVGETAMAMTKVATSTRKSG